MLNSGQALRFLPEQDTASKHHSTSTISTRAGVVGVRSLPRDIETTCSNAPHLTPFHRGVNRETAMPRPPVAPRGVAYELVMEMAAPLSLRESSQLSQQDRTTLSDPRRATPQRYTSGEYRHTTGCQSWPSGRRRQRSASAALGGQG